MLHRIRSAVAAAAAALLGIAGISIPGADERAPAPHPGHPVIRNRHRDHDDQPHTPERELTEIPGQDTEVLETHVLVLDHPRYGVLNDLNYFGYCDDCPVAGTGLRCGGIAGRCPGV